MKFPITDTLALRVLTTLTCASLAACGGTEQQADLSASSATAAAVTVAMGGASALSKSSSSTYIPASRGTVAGTTPTNAPGVITDVRFESTNALQSQANQPLSFGQVFAVGDLSPATTLVGRVDDGSTIPLQVDVKALHADGSVRHAVISAVVPSIAAGVVRTVKLEKSSAAAGVSTSSVSKLIGQGFTASVQASINGVQYTASAADLLKNAANVKTWLSGPVANEWQVSAPLMTSSGQPHPHLTARFAIRWYEASKKARVDVTVENNWAYEAAPQNFTYDAKVTVDGKAVYTKAAMTHLHHSRWRKVFWSGGDAPQINVKHNVAYMIGTRALPNYDQSISVPETSLAALKASWKGAATEPMGVGMADNYMPRTGGRVDIGLLPGWAAQYLLSMDKRAKEVTLGTADLAGSWSSHYRDRNTDRPISLIDYPYMTILGRSTDTKNPVTKKYEAFPACATKADCGTPNTHDTPHQPAFAYLPYLVTGDYYYLEELQFWAMYSAFSSNPGYRQNVKGLVLSDQIRGQAWSMRTLAEAAYITPDSDRLKSHFTGIVDNNLEWYNANYTNNAAANKLGVLLNGPVLSYNDGRGLSPWMDDFFTSAIGHVLDLGFTKAEPLLRWKAQFSISRMTGPGACWMSASSYVLNLRDSETSPLYTTIGEVYKASVTPEVAAMACNSPQMASALGVDLGEMIGYARIVTGYPANMQPALAYSADALGAQGKAAWTLFQSRSVKPDYGTAPEFAIVPRN